MNVGFARRASRGGNWGESRPNERHLRRRAARLPGLSPRFLGRPQAGRRKTNRVLGCREPCASPSLLLRGLRARSAAEAAEIG